MGKLDGKVAFITGAARGQGRSHAVTLASEGANIIAIDLCEQIDTVPYPMATEDDLAETVRLVESAGGKILARKADVRNFDSLQAAVDDGIAQFGRLDIVVANAGTVNGLGVAWSLTEEQFHDQYDVVCAGVWRTCKAAIPAMIEQNEGGSIVLTGSISGLVAEINIAHYVAAKHGVVGLLHNLAAELAPYNIRVNAVAPTTVRTPMVENQAFTDLFAGKVGASWEDALPGMQGLHSLPVPFVEPIDVSYGVLYLASDEARFVTGTNLVIDAGAMNPFKVPHDNPGGR